MSQPQAVHIGLARSILETLRVEIAASQLTESAWGKAENISPLSEPYLRLAHRPLVTDRAIEAWYHLGIA